MSIKKQAVWPDPVWLHLVLLSRDPVDARRRVVQALPWRLHIQRTRCGFNISGSARINIDTAMINDRRRQQNSAVRISERYSSVVKQTANLRFLGRGWTPQRNRKDQRLKLATPKSLAARLCGRGNSGLSTSSRVRGILCLAAVW
jgi:hypothetical protein